MQLLPSRNPAYRLGVHRDDEGGDALCPIGIVPREKLVPVELIIGLAPMASDLRLVEDLQETRKTVLAHGTKDDARTLKEALQIMCAMEVTVADKTYDVLNALRLIAIAWKLARGSLAT